MTMQTSGSSAAAVVIKDRTTSKTINQDSFILILVQTFFCNNTS
jgi:hypothetical protein